MGNRYYLTLRALGHTGLPKKTRSAIVWLLDLVFTGKHPEACSVTFNPRWRQPVYTLVSIQLRTVVIRNGT